MKYLIISLFLTIFALPTHAAVGWFYTDELRAIEKALDNDKSDKARGSYLESIAKTSSGFKVMVSGCSIFLDRIPQSNFDRGMTGPNPEIRLRVNKNKSSCR